LIDFDHSLVDGMGAAGFSAGHAFLNRLLNLPPTLLDEYESACYVALSWKKQGFPNREGNPSVRTLIRDRVELMCAILSGAKADLVHQRLLYLYTRRGSDDFKLDDFLSQQFSFSFTEAQDEYRALLNNSWKVVPPSLTSTATDERSIRGELLEKYSNSLGSLWQGGEVPELFANYNVHSPTSPGATFTEFDGVLESEEGRFPVPMCNLVDPLERLPGGRFLVVEIWGGTKTNLQKKFQALLPGHRACHVLMFYHRFFLVGESLAFPGAVLEGPPYRASDFFTRYARCFSRVFAACSSD
jgi:hypothetical protein